MQTPTTNSSHLIEPYRGKTVLITGARGYIGCALATALAEAPCRLVLLDRSPTTPWWKTPSRAEILPVTGDVARRETWECVLPKVDVVFHLAAIESFGEDYRVLPDFEVNTLSVLHLLETCRERGLRPRVIYSSSANLFGPAKHLPVGEDAPDLPATAWSLHKLASEHYLRLYADQLGLAAGSLRLANVYGAVPRPECLLRVALNRMVAAALRKGILPLYRNQACVRDYLYIADAVSAFLRAGDPEVPFAGRRYYVVGSGDGRTIREVAEAIARAASAQTGKAVRLEVNAARTMGAFEMRNFAADNRQFTTAAGWRPQTPLEQGLQFTLKALA
jgi:UDP-glucose 4-epimerase